MANPTPPVPFLLALLLLLILPFIFSPNGEFVRFAEAGKRRVHITDDLDDVVDEEEDDTWKEWGKKTKPSSDFDPPPDLSKMDKSQIQAEMMKRQTGPAFGFVKLRMGEKRTRVIRICSSFLLFIGFSAECELGMWIFCYLLLGFVSDLIIFTWNSNLLVLV